MSAARERKAGVPEYLAGGCLGLLTLLLPLKFAGLAVMPEATGFFPEHAFDYLFITWPPAAFGIVTGILLAGVMLVFPPERKVWRDPAGITALLWVFGFPLAALPGFLNCDTIDYAIGELFHLCSFGAYLWALYLVLSRRPEWKKIYLGILVAGVCLTALAGLRQYFWGFEEMRQFAQQQYEAGIILSGEMRAKIEDDRVFATFTSCNALGGYLVLMLPLAGFLFWKAGKRFEPAKISSPLLAGITLFCLCVVLLLTRGRGALVAALLASGGFVLTLPMKRLYRWGLLAGAVLLIAGVGVYAKTHGRGLGSAMERYGYLNTTAVMVAEKPLAGHGWGGFFYRHMLLRVGESDEAAHDPHNVILSFAGQAGVPAALLVLAAFLYPLGVLGRRILRRQAAGLDQALFWGGVAFFLHSMLEINLQVPASMAIAGGVLIAMLIPETEEEGGETAASRLKYLWLLPALVLAGASIAGNWHILRAEITLYELQNTIQSPVAARKRPPAPAEVEKALTRAVEARPYSPFPWETAGDYYLGIRNYRRAEECFLESQKRTLSRPSVYGRLHRIEHQRGNHDRARELLLEMYRRFPNSPKYIERVRLLYPDALPGPTGLRR